jgi:hypothetical protein
MRRKYGATDRTDDLFSPRVFGLSARNAEGPSSNDDRERSITVRKDRDMLWSFGMSL